MHCHQINPKRDLIIDVIPDILVSRPARTDKLHDAPADVRDLDAHLVLEDCRLVDAHLAQPTDHVLVFRTVARQDLHGLH